MRFRDIILFPSSFFFSISDLSLGTSRCRTIFVLRAYRGQFFEPRFSLFPFVFRSFRLPQTDLGLVRQALHVEAVFSLRLIRRELFESGFFPYSPERGAWGRRGFLFLFF